MAYPSIPPRPAYDADWTALGDAWHAALTQALSDDPVIRAGLTSVKGTVAGLAAGLAPTANPSFTGTVTGISKGMVGLGNVDNTADAAKAIDGAQITSGVLDPARLPAGCAAIRTRLPAGEANPSATNWAARPSGYPIVLSIGAPPGPVDALATDIHVPTATAAATSVPQPIGLTDGSTIPVWTGSDIFDQAQLVGAITTQVTAQATYDAYTSRLPAAKLLPGFRQMAANACALLYTSAAQVPRKHPNLTLVFSSTSGVLAQAWSQTSTIEFGPLSVGAAVTASYSTHEVVHLFQHSPTNGTAQTSGVIEGIADWVLVQMGYHTAANQRPAGGGTAWDAGYDTTAFFFDWIERVAGGGTPGFVRALNQSLNVPTWNQTVITALNVQGKTVDALWVDYKAWLNPAPLPQAAGLAGSWALSFADEFTGTAVNSSNWSRLRGNPATGLYDSPYSPANDDSSWDAAYATVSDGLLRLRWDRTPSESYGITYPYTAGIVTSEGLRSFTPEVFIEARIWFTDTPGLWPAFWLDPLVGWPPEIDIAEFVPDDTPDGLYKPHFNYHWSEGGVHRQMGWKWYGTAGQSIAGAWHTYGLHWTTSKLQVYLDGQPGPSYAGPGITSQDMYIILSSGVRKGHLPAAGEMRVDYVRSWTPGGQGALTDRTSVPYTASNGAAATYHAWAAGRATGAPLLVWLHGDGAWEHDNPNSAYVFGGAGGVRQVCADRGVICVSAQSPDATGTRTWWENPTRNVTYLTDLIGKLKTDYSPSRIILAGYSGGAQFATQYFIPQKSGVLGAGGSIVFGGGGKPVSPTNPSFTTTFKNSWWMHWATGALDTAANSSEGYDALGFAQAGASWYQTAGFSTSTYWIPGRNHMIDGLFGGIVAARLDGTPVVTPPTQDAGWKEVALRITSTAENSTTNWTTAYSYIEDINDGRGYTAGIVGWCSGTGDMLVLVQYAAQQTPGNLLEKWIPKLQQIMAAAYSQRPSLSDSLLGSAFIADWKTAAAQAWFQAAQRAERDRLYWGPAAAQAAKDGVGNCGRAVMYDISVNHGQGSDPESFGGICAAAAAQAKPPSQGGTEKAYLLALCDKRDAVLRSWGDYQSNGRSPAFRNLVNNNMSFTFPITWSMYGSNYSITSLPTGPG